MSKRNLRGRRSIKPSTISRRILGKFCAFEASFDGFVRPRLSIRRLFVTGIDQRFSHSTFSPARKQLEALWNSSSSAPSGATPSSDAKPPQKPFDAIRVYIDDKKEKFAKKNPELNASEINRRLTAKYNQLSEEKKEKYKKKALAMKEDHQRGLRVS